MKALRQWRLVIALALCGLLAAYAFWLEPEWLQVNELRLSDKPTLTLAHISDLHYKGEKNRMLRMVDIINRRHPDVVCFTGDLVEDAAFLGELLRLLGKLDAPIVGVPGNHDYWSHADFDQIRMAFQKKGGAWLLDEAATIKGVAFFGATERDRTQPLPSGKPRILLCHYPAVIDRLEGMTFDLTLAGHTHGGQLRVPGYGALILPLGSGDYDKGLFSVGGNRLHVSKGIGTWFIEARFWCRPEIAFISL